MNVNPRLALISDEEFSEAYQMHGPSKLARMVDISEHTLKKRAKRLNVIAPATLSFNKLKNTSDKDLKDTVERLGIDSAAKFLKLGYTTVRRRVEKMKQEGVEINPLNPAGKREIDQSAREHPQRYEIEVQTGTAIIFSDAHYWPGKASVAHRALVKMVHEKTPEAIICNGDAVDMAQASRHPPIGWEARPTIQQEIEAAQERLGEILSACTKRTRKAWNLGNHDARFETRLAAVAPEYAKVAGIHLHDHFPEWERAWSTWINNDVVVKHRWKGGDHATWNNTIKSGKTTVTGHLHSAHVQPFTDYNGTRFGVDTGCLANTYGPQFTNYTEDNPRNWVSGFGILTFRKGQLLWPELVVAWDKDHVQYRGEIIRV